MATDPQELTFIEMVRKRPGMYVGETKTGAGLHQLLWEVIANALDQHFIGRVSSVRVDCSETAVTVEDDGPGLASDDTELASLFLEWHNSPTRDGHYPHVHFGLTHHGVGLAVVSALASRLDVATRGPGGALSAVFAKGVLEDRDCQLEPPARLGTRLRIVPDAEVFGHDAAFNQRIVREHLEWLAYLNPELRVVLNTHELTAPDGLTTACAALSGAAPTDVIAMRGVLHDVLVDVALVWRGEGEADVVSYVSQVQSKDGGTHVAGMWRGLRRALTAVATDVSPVGAKTADFRDRVGRGLTAIVHAGLYHPKWGSPTKDKLESEEACTAVADVVFAALHAEFLLRPKLRRTLLDRFASPSDGASTALQFDSKPT